MSTKFFKTRNVKVFTINCNQLKLQITIVYVYRKRKSELPISEGLITPQKRETSIGKNKISTLLCKKKVSKTLKLYIIDLRPLINEYVVKQMLRDLFLKCLLDRASKIASKMVTCPKVKKFFFLNSRYRNNEANN